MCNLTNFYSFQIDRPIELNGCEICSSGDEGALNFHHFDHGNNSL